MDSFIQVILITISDSQITLTYFLLIWQVNDRLGLSYQSFVISELFLTNWTWTVIISLAYFIVKATGCLFLFTVQCLIGCKVHQKGGIRNFIVYS